MQKKNELLKRDQYSDDSISETDFKEIDYLINGDHSNRFQAK